MYMLHYHYCYLYFSHDLLLIDHEKNKDNISDNVACMSRYHYFYIVDMYVIVIPTLTFVWCTIYLFSHLLAQQSDPQ